MILRVQDISLLDVFRRYVGITDYQVDGKRYKIVCPFHDDKSPSLVVFDKTEQGKGWDYHCFVCGAHGTAVTVLVEKGLAQDEEEATEILKRDFGLVLPDIVTVDMLCAVKGLDPEFAKRQGWVDAPDGAEIPFFDSRGNVVNTKVRTKYEGKGVKYKYRGNGQQAIPFGLQWLDSYESDILYITEGETDAMTLRQAGYPVLGIAGAMGFKAEYAAYISRFKSIVVVKDNDEAGWGLIEGIAEQFSDKLYMLVLPKGIKDINNYHINRCNCEVEVFRTSFDTLPLLPATPSTFITAVSEGIVPVTEPACWNMVVRAHKSPAEILVYKETFAAETKTAKSIVNACLKGAQKPVSEIQKEEGEFIIMENCYYKEVFRGDSIVQERISNFTLHPEADVVSDSEVYRVCQLTNNQGGTISGVYFGAEELASCTKFNQKCVSVGDYIFTGTQEDLFKICSLIFKSPKPVIQSPRQIGRLDSGEWLFGNCGINLQGEIVPVEAGVVHLSSGTYKPRGVNIADMDGDSGNSFDIPAPDLSAVNSFTPEFLSELARDFKQTFGTFSAWTALGWVVAGWYSNEIFARNLYFPHLFVTGKRASGKSVFCTMLQTAYGFKDHQAGMSIEGPTNVGITRYLSYRSSLPQWYDDYRNNVRRIQMKDNLLLDIYNRHGALKGTKTGGITSEQIRGFLLLSGEDTPSNNALLSRCVPITLSANYRDPSTFHKTKNEMRSLFEYGIRWGCEAASGNTDGLFAKIDEVYAKLMYASPDLRDSGNKSIFAGAFLYAFGDCLSEGEVDAYLADLMERAEEDSGTVIEEHAELAFFDDFFDLHVQSGADYKFDGELLHINMGTVYDMWVDRYRGAAPLSKQVLKKYIKEEPFFVDDKVVKYGSKSSRSITIRPALMSRSEYEVFLENVKYQKCTIEF